MQPSKDQNKCLDQKPDDPAYIYGQPSKGQNKCLDQKPDDPAYICGQPSKDQYKCLDQKPYDSAYMYADVIIDHPVEKVWPHVLNIGSWMNAHRLETIAGESGKVGHFERVFPRGLGDEVGLPHYHLYGIAEVIPLKYIALEVFPEKGGSYGNAREWVSLDGILLIDLNGRTKIVFLLIDVQMVKGDEDSRKHKQQELDGLRKILNGYFENLKQLVK